MFAEFWILLLMFGGVCV